MIRHALILALLVPLGASYHPQYLPAGPHFPTATVYNACLIAGWPMNEGTGTTLNDVSTNANTATINNLSNVSWASNSGFPGSSLLFTGSFATTVIATSTSQEDFTGLTAFSVAVWVNITQTTEQTIIGTLAPSTYAGWEMGLNTVGSGKMDFILAHAYGSNAIVVHGSTTIQNTGKHYLVATYDGSQTAAGTKLYVDGVAETVNVDQNTLSLTAVSGRPVRIAYRFGDGEPVKGVIAASAVYNCVLSSGQVSTYNALGPQVN